MTVAPSTASRTLDFVVVGAAKSGTTALFEYARTHPQLAMPREKETGFFAVDELYERGWSWYVNTYLDDLPSSRVYGEASPAYMWGTPYSGSPLHAPTDAPPAAKFPETLERVVPARIAETLPEVKIVCVLRDPIDRAISHYRMSRLWDWDARTVDEALRELIEPDRLSEARRWVTGTTWYLVLGEYGRILQPYFDLFPRNRILVLFSEDLSTRREEVLQEFFNFIGVAPDWVPPNLEVTYRQGASARRFQGLDLYRWRDRAARLRRLKAAWRSIPERERDRLDRLYTWATFRLDLWNAKRGDDGLDVSPELRRELERHFQVDGAVLTELLGRQAPWLERWGQS